MLKTILGLLAVIILVIASAMFLDDSTMSFFRSDHIADSPIILSNVTNSNTNEFLMNTQVSDDIPIHF